MTVDVLASRTYPAFREAAVVAEILPPNLLGDYHLTGTGSPAYGAGHRGDDCQLGHRVRWPGPTRSRRRPTTSRADPRPSGARRGTTPAPTSWSP